jgi:hypothetical protein
MISFELAKDLKQAEFPPSEVARAQQQAGYDYVSMPTLSALIVQRMHFVPACQVRCSAKRLCDRRPSAK